MAERHSHVSTSPSNPVARMDSLPFSLRHCARWEALKDARHLATFLHEVNYLQQVTAETSSGTLCTEWPALQGMQLVLCLLADKLDIAAGAYRFPFAGLAADYPKLAERVNPDDADEPEGGADE